MGRVAYIIFGMEHNGMHHPEKMINKIVVLPENLKSNVAYFKSISALKYCFNAGLKFQV